MKPGDGEPDRTPLTAAPVEPILLHARSTDQDETETDVTTAGISTQREPRWFVAMPACGSAVRHIYVNDLGQPRLGGRTGVPL